MTINEPLYAMIDPATLRVLGDGEFPAIYSTPPDEFEVDMVRALCGIEPKVIKCRIVPVEELSP